jgi:hypothetical protein
MSSEVRVHVRLGAVSLEFQGDRSFYESHVERWVAAAAKGGIPPASPNGRAAPAGEARAAAPAAAAPPAAPEPVRASSPAPAERARPAFVPTGDFGRFLKRLGPEAGEPDRQVTAFAFYLWNYEKRETFGESEIVGCFRALGLPPPEDLPAILEDLTERRRFLESSQAGAWRLSRKGENYVKTRLLAA